MPQRVDWRKQPAATSQPDGRERRNEPSANITDIAASRPPAFFDREGYMTTTRSSRAVLAGAATLPALASPVAGRAASPITDREAEIARAEKIVDTLTPWGIDANRAAQFIECVRTYDPQDDWDSKFLFVLEWMGEHAPQSVDWLFWGDAKGQILGDFRCSEVPTALALPMTRVA
jgi:hypothetical protein